MTQPTSAEAYRWIQESGLLQPLHRQILARLADTQCSMTSGEIAGTINARINTVTPRLTELRAMGSVREGEKRACQVTGRNCLTWELTGNEPIEAPKKVRCICQHCDGTGLAKPTPMQEGSRGTSISPTPGTDHAGVTSHNPTS